MRSTAIIGAVLALALAGSCSDPIAPGPIVGTTVIVNNMLLAPVRVKLNGVDVGLVEPSSRRSIPRGDLASVRVDWELVAPRIDGHVIGDTMRAGFNALRISDGETISFDIDNTIFDGTRDVSYYAPILSNSTSAPIVIGVNMDTPRELRLGALPPGQKQRFIGYYRLEPGTGIRAYRPETPYGPMLYIERAFGHAFDLSDLADGSGTLDLDFTSDPP